MKLEEAIKSSRFTDEKHKAAINILYTAWWLKNSFSLLIKKEDITLEQYNVMRILRGMHPEAMCVKDIGSRIIEKSSNVPRIIDRLVLKKMVKRTPSKLDKRETLVSLTDKGMNILAKTITVIDQVHKDAGIDEKEAMLLNELLEKMRVSKAGGQ